MRQLDVYWNGVLAGTLTEQTAGKGYCFKYDTSYLSGDFPPITLTLPKTKVPYNSETLFPFFANILPEGALRRVVCRRHRVDENDLFGILCAMSSADSIGAVNVKEVRDER